MRIAVVEDNLTLAQAIAFRLRGRGHAVDELHDGDAAADFLLREGADIVILDINLPGQSGLEVLRGLRAAGNSAPVILLTARGDTDDRVAGLDAGADDYLVKPFEMDELEARLRALSRRRNIAFEHRERIGGLEFDRGTRQVHADGRVLEMPRREVAVFECLLDRRGRMVAKAQLIDHVYGVGSGQDDSAVEPHVSRLRRRIADHGVVIRTARGLGYMLDADR